MRWRVFGLVICLVLWGLPRHGHFGVHVRVQGYRVQGVRLKLRDLVLDALSSIHGLHEQPRLCAPFWVGGPQKTEFESPESKL